jgi:hypothetical protein
MPLDDARVEETKAWFRKASEDLRAADLVRGFVLYIPFCPSFLLPSPKLSTPDDPRTVPFVSSTRNRKDIGVARGKWTSWTQVDLADSGRC